MADKKFQELRDLMRMNLLTQEETARLAGMKPATLSRKLTGHEEFRPSEINNLCKVLKIPASKIVKYFFAQ